MATESVTYDKNAEGSNKLTTTNVPLVKTETRKVTYNTNEDEVEDPGELVSAQSHSSRTQTVETTTVRRESPHRRVVGGGGGHTVKLPLTWSVLVNLKRFTSVAGFITYF